MTEQQLLKALRVRYEKTYVTPLINKFPKPLIMFDEEQIRLKKQIEVELERIEKSEICPDCRGRGTIIEYNTHSLRNDPNWNSPWLEQVIDSRAIKNDKCIKCLGDGIIFPKEETNESGESVIIAKTGTRVLASEIDNLACDYCRKKLLWDFQDDEEKPYFEATCHGRVYLLKGEVFSISVRPVDKRETGHKI